MLIILFKWLCIYKKIQISFDNSKLDYTDKMEPTAYSETIA